MSSAMKDLNFKDNVPVSNRETDSGSVLNGQTLKTRNIVITNSESKTKSGQKPEAGDVLGSERDIARKMTPAAHSIN